MDFRVTPTIVPVCATVADAFNEQPVDGDFVLPDYCPDIAAVLKCTLTAQPQSRQLSTDRLLVDGTVQIHVLYLDEERRSLRACEFSQPFSASFPLPAVTGSTMVQLCAKTDYVNCRAVSPRRLDVHGAFTLKLHAVAPHEETVIAALEGDGVYTRRCMVHSTVPTATVEKPLTVNEVLECGAGKSAAEQTLRTTATPVITDCKVLTNKAIVKGTLYVQALYAADAAAGTLERAEGEIPFSQILDMDGLTEEWLCDADVAVVSSDIHMETSQAGDSALLAVQVKLLVTLQGWQSESVEIVSDAYSTHCPLVCENATLTAVGFQGVQQEERVVRQSVEVPSDTIGEVLDTWCEATGLSMSGEGETLTLEGRLLWCMLVREQSGTLSYYERAEAVTLPFEDGGRDETPHVRVVRTACQRNGGRLELRADLCVTRRCVQNITCPVLRHAAANEEAVYPPDAAGLKICYANQGESLWDIACRCHTSVEAVMEENHLTGDVLAADTMLLIPLS